MSNASETERGRLFHYVITLQFEARNGIQPVYHEDGVYKTTPGQTRRQVYRDIFDGACRRGSGLSPVPLFFSLEPDSLEPAW
jgi:hypothetical protein